MKIGPKTFAFLEKVVHPPTPRDMRKLVDALIRDNDIDRARQVAETMLDHFTKAEGGHDDFYYWMGVRQTIRAVVDSKFDRWRKRIDRKWQNAERVS